LSGQLNKTMTGDVVGPVRKPLQPVVNKVRPDACIIYV
jgi:hypothetical protein